MKVSNVICGLIICVICAYALVKFIQNIPKINLEIIGGALVTIIILIGFVFGLIIMFNKE